MLDPPLVQTSDSARRTEAPVAAQVSGGRTDGSAGVTNPLEIDFSSG
jgi:hypothetical protein